ncbi:MAG TPA: VanZ family protein [Verrucomicrobiae bacterium]|nr:VanZ family protein [Verrucomicrobiae bacterium]
MPKVRSFLLYWVPVIVWMSLIFTASGDTGSFQHSSRIIGPLLRWLFPSISHETEDAIVFGVRKCAHLTEYAVVAFLVWRGIRKPRWKDPRPWKWSEAGVALWVAMFYATTDEFHQTFVPSREGCVRDVLIDSTGAVVGMFALWLLGRLFKKW